MKKLHKWNEEDTIVCFYFSKYGVVGIPVRDEIDLAHNIIGSSLSSLIMQTSNLRYLMGFMNNLSDYSTLQEKVYNDFKDMNRLEFVRIVTDIVKRRRNINKENVIKHDNNYRIIKRNLRNKVKELEETFKSIKIGVLNGVI
jgi:hypothetical protein